MRRDETDDVESPYKIVQPYFFFYKVVFCITLLTPHGGRHGACCVMSYGLYLQCNTTLESLYDVIEQFRVGSQEFADWFKFSQRWPPRNR